MDKNLYIINARCTVLKDKEIGFCLKSCIWDCSLISAKTNCEILFIKHVSIMEKPLN